MHQYTKLTMCGAAFGLVLAITTKCAHAQNWDRPPMWGPPAYMIERYDYYRPRVLSQYQQGYRFYDAPMSEGLFPRWSDPRAQWPSDYRYRRECWFKNGC